MSPVLPCLRTLNFGNLLFSFLLAVFSVNFLTVFGSVMSRQAKENVCDAQSIPVRLHCPFENCHKSYNSKKHLNEHFRLHPSHKPHTLPSTRVRVTAKECAEKFLDDETNIFGKVNDQRQELLKKIGIESNVFGELVVGHVDVEKYITLFLSQTGTQSAINMDYTDGFPWLK